MGVPYMEHRENTGTLPYRDHRFKEGGIKTPNL
jgi:hypothetical protein